MKKKTKTKKTPAICRVWADAIENEIRTVDDIPKKYKKIVIEILKERGLYEENEKETNAE